MTLDNLVGQNAKTVYTQRSSPMRYNWPHIQKVMDARKKQELSYSLIFHVNENNSPQATILADPITKRPTFVIAY